MPDENNDKTAEMESLQYLNQIYGDRYSAITAEIRSVIDEIEDLNRSVETLSNFDSVKGKRMLTMAGRSLFVYAIAEPEEKVLVEVGGGYLIEKSIEEGKQFLSTSIESKNKYLNSLTVEKEKLENALLEISYKLSQEQDSYV
jgi:prefoldin alpha subunit